MYMYIYTHIYGLPWWLSWWGILLQCGRSGFNPWVGKIPWRWERLPTPVFCPENSMDYTVHAEKATATHSSTLAWTIPWTEEPGRLQSMGSQRVGRNWATSLSLSCIGEGNGNPLQCSHPNLTGVLSQGHILFSRRGRINTRGSSYGSHRVDSLEKCTVSEQSTQLSNWAQCKWLRGQWGPPPIIINPTLENVILPYLRIMIIHLWF